MNQQASLKVKWGILGGSNILEFATGEALKAANNSEIVALATHRAGRHQVFHKILGHYKEYQEYDALLNDPDIEAVYISLPNSLHKEWSIKALNAGKHVLCEKPLSISEADVVEMQSVAKRNNKFLMEGFAFLHNPIWRIIEKTIQNLGNINFICTHFYDQEGDGGNQNITLRRPSYGGSVYDIGCYNVAFLLYLLKEEPDQIQGFANFRKTNIDDFASFLFTYSNNIKASLQSYIGCSQRDDSIEIFAERGKLIIPLEYNFSGQSFLYVQEVNKEIQKISVSSPNNYVLEFEQFGRCILEGEKPLVSSEFSIKQARTIDRMLRIINY